MYRILAAALVAAMVPGFAAAIEVTREVELAAPPDEVWSRIGGFCAIADWHPAVATCAEEQIDGAAHRRLALEGGGEILERRSDGGGDTGYAYAIVESPLPVANYSSTFSVAAEGEGSVLTWSGQFDAANATDDEAEAVIAGIYDAGLQAIAESFAE